MTETGSCPRAWRKSSKISACAKGGEKLELLLQYAESLPPLPELAGGSRQPRWKRCRSA